MNLEERIKEIATTHAPDYPMVATITAWEQLWAIEQTMLGMDAAIEDWRALVEHMGRCLGWNQADIVREGIRIARERDERRKNSA